MNTVKRTIPKVQEHEDTWYFLGYVRDEGAAWTLVGLEEEQVDSLIAEFKERGTLTARIEYGQHSEVIEPIAVSKLKSVNTYYKTYTTVEEEVE